MAKVTINTITSGYATIALLNANFDALADAIENTLSRDGTSPNTMSANLDMNSNRILNLPEPINASEAARLADVTAAIAGDTAANLISFTPAGTIAATTVQGAIEELDSEKLASSAISAFGLTLVDDTTAAAARTTLGAALAPDAQGDITIGETSSAQVSVPSPLGGAQIINGKIALSVGSSALTAALKGLDGNDPSATNPVFIRIPQLTSNVFDGTYAIRKVVAALSMVVSSGSTLGHTSAVACPVYFYLMDVAGVLAFAVSSRFFGAVGYTTTAAEGGAGGADIASTIYSTSAQASAVPIACVGRWKSTQTTAGTWAAVTGEQQLYPFPFKAPTVTTITATGANNYDMPWDAVYAVVEIQAASGSSGAVAATGAGQIARASGAGGGEYAKKVLKDGSVVVGRTVVTVGAGGTAPSAGANNGNTGGTTSFGAIFTAIGGGGGQAGPADNTVGPSNDGGIGGAGGTGGDIHIPGEPGEAGLGWNQTLVNNGRGGNSFFGAAGRGRYTTTSFSGETGLGKGGGPSGPCITQSQSAVAGVVGTNGVAVITEFYQ